MINRDLLERYCKNECTDEEEAFVSAWLHEHPEEWAQLFAEEEAAETEQELSPVISEKMLDIIHAEAFGRRPVVRWMRGISVAASLILVFGAGWYLLRNRHPAESKVLAQRTNAPQAEEGGWLIYDNETGKDSAVVLADGSAVRLSGHSLVRVAKGFKESGERIVWLEGEAQFTVRHDKDRAFIVRSGDISTRDIGTDFSIRNRDKEDLISVKLFSGRVEVFSNLDSGNRFPAKGLLNPGEEFLYSRENRTASIRVMHPKEDLVNARAGTSGFKTGARPDWFRFEGQPLTQVLQQLSVYYQMDIYYDPTELTDRYFTGKFDQKDSLKNILQDLALLNGLTATKKGGGYILKK